MKAIDESVHFRSTWLILVVGIVMTSVERIELIWADNLYKTVSQHMQHLINL